MNRIVLSTTLTLAAAAPFAAHAEDSSGDDDLNRFSLGPRIGMNFQAHFRSLAPNSLSAGPAAGGANGHYLDGYVLGDSSGNAGGLTWNWGYQNASQVVGDTMQFHSAPSTSISSAGDSSSTSDAQLGLELVYQRILGHLPFGSSTRWGLETGFGYTDIDLHDNSSSIQNTTFSTDAYQLNGVLPPSAGYHGTFQGPGALLGDTPTQTSTSIFNLLPSQQKLSGQLLTIRLGPFAEWNFTSKFSLAASAGLALAPASIDYDFSGVSQSSLHSSKTDLLYGAFVGATLRYDFARHWGAYIGAQFQCLTDMNITAGAHSAQFDPGATIYLTAGLSFKF